MAIQYAVHIAQDGRPGPVWIDIPGDVQTAEMPEEYRVYTGPYEQLKNPINYQTIKDAIDKSERPIVLAGYGIRQSDCINEFKQFIAKYQIPYVSTYGARDYTANEYPFNIGAVGIKGSRAGNFAMQNADLLLVLGSSLGGSVIGYSPEQFSPASYKIVVDIDKEELGKDIIKIDEKINASLKEFFGAML